MHEVLEDDYAVLDFTTFNISPSDDDEEEDNQPSLGNELFEWHASDRHASPGTFATCYENFGPVRPRQPKTWGLYRLPELMPMMDGRFLIGLIVTKDLVQELDLDPDFHQTGEATLYDAFDQKRSGMCFVRFPKIYTKQELKSLYASGARPSLVLRLETVRGEYHELLVRSDRLEVVLRPGGFAYHFRYGLSQDADASIYCDVDEWTRKDFEIEVQHQHETFDEAPRERKELVENQYQALQSWNEMTLSLPGGNRLGHSHLLDWIDDEREDNEEIKHLVPYRIGDRTDYDDWGKDVHYDRVYFEKPSGLTRLVLPEVSELMVQPGGLVVRRDLWPGPDTSSFYSVYPAQLRDCFGDLHEDYLCVELEDASSLDDLYQAGEAGALPPLLRFDFGNANERIIIRRDVVERWGATFLFRTTPIAERRRRWISIEARLEDWQRRSVTMTEDTWANASEHD